MSKIKTTLEELGITENTRHHSYEYVYAALFQLQQENEELRSALRWSLSWLEDDFFYDEEEIEKLEKYLRILKGGKQ